jgi:probable addiction module antidote protein
MKKVPPAVPHEEGLHEYLRNPSDAVTYLNAVVEDGDPDGILLSLYDIAKAYNMSHIAERIKVNRPSLYKMLTKGGNPSFRNILKVLDAIGIGIRFVPARADGKHPKHALAA